MFRSKAVILPEADCQLQPMCESDEGRQGSHLLPISQIDDRRSKLFSSGLKTWYFYDILVGLSRDERVSKSELRAVVST